MASTVTLGVLVNQTRRLLRDWSDFDALTGAVTDTTGTAVTVADSTLYAKRWPIEIDQETMLIRAIPSATSLTVERGAFGSTAATHSNAAAVLIRPDFFAVEIIDAINQGILACFPSIYKEVTDETVTSTDSTYEYTLPSMPGTYSGATWPIPRVYDINVKQSGDPAWREIKRWELVRGATPKFKLRSPEPAGSTFRIRGFGPFPPLTTTATVIDAQWPPDANYLLPIYAAASMLLSGEARRVRVDTGATDAREQATRAGASMQIGIALYNRWRQELQSCSLPPLPKHVKQVV